MNCERCKKSLEETGTCSLIKFEGGVNAVLCPPCQSDLNFLILGSEEWRECVRVQAECAYYTEVAKHDLHADALLMLKKEFLRVGEDGRQCCIRLNKLVHGLIADYSKEASPK